MTYRSSVGLALTLAIVLTGLTQAPAQVPAATPLLAPTGLPAGPAHRTLIQGAIAHLQINSLEQLAFDVDELVMSAFPESAAPPPLQELLSKPHPLLAFVGLQTVQAPLDAELISGLTGIDSRRPLSATLYMAPGGPSVVLTIPVADYRAFTGMLLNVTMTRALETASLQGVSCYHVQPAKPNLPKHLYVLCSADRAYICTSEMTATQLGSAPPAARLGADSFVSSSIEGSTDSDLLLCLDTAILKQFLPMVEGPFATVNPMQIQQLRAKIPAELKPSINARLRAQTNFSSIDELLDYAECFATAAYEIMVKDIIEMVRGSQGMSVAMDISKSHQSMKVTVASSQIQPAVSTQPIPLSAIRPHVAQLPGSRDILTLSGRKPVVKPDAFTQRWVPLVRQKMKEKSLTSETTERLLSHLLSIRPKQPLESLAPWSVTTLLQGDAIVIPEKAETLDAWFKAVARVTPLQPVRATIMPIRGEALKTHFARETRNAKRELQDGKALATLANHHTPLMDKTLKITAGSLGDDTTQLTMSTIYRTQLGYFGFDEHELVNRRFVNYRPHADALCIERGAREPRWLKRATFGQPTALRGAIVKLLDRAPAQASAIQILSSETVIPSLLKLGASAEEAVHTELKHYLLKVRKAYAVGRATVDTAALALAMPAYVSSVNRHADSGKIYLVLLGDITYPRARLMPAVEACFRDVTDQAGSMGGAASYARTLPGRHEMEAVQSSEALALMIRSVGNHIFMHYVKTPAAQAALKRLTTGRYDNATGQVDILFTNPSTTIMGGIPRP